MEEKNQMSESNIGSAVEYLCPACGAALTEEERIAGGWDCKCGDFIPEGLAINPSTGCSCRHKQNCSWR